MQVKDGLQSGDRELNLGLVDNADALSTRIWEETGFEGQDNDGFPGGS